ncbi:MAG: hypothetical protein WCT05_10865 [Lentisphaeria bacterium]
MQESGDFLKEEWEALILAGVILLVLVFLGWSFSGAKRLKFSPAGSISENGQLPFFDPELLSCLQSTQLPPPSRNPFFFTFQFSPPQPEVKEVRVIEKPIPEKNPGKIPTSKTLELVEDPIEETPSTAQGQPVFRLQVKRVTYVYSQADSTGKTTAVVKIRGAEGKEELFTPGTGEKVLGMSILFIRSENLKLLDATGKQVTIPFGESKSVMVWEKTK